MSNEINPNEIQKPKKKDRTIQYFLIVLAILLFAINSIYDLKKPTSGDVFQDSLEAKKYDVYDLTNEYADSQHILNVLGTEKGSMHLEFFEIDSNDHATATFENFKTVIKESEPKASGESSSGTTKYTLTTPETYYIVARNKNTLILAYADRSDKNIVNELAAEFMPRSATLIMVLFITGYFLIFLSVGFMLQERKKRNSGNVLTIATVIGNEKKATTNMPKDRHKTHYGASRAYSYSPIVSYYVNSELREETYGNGFAKPIPEGTKVEIKYNSKNPADFYFADEKREQPFKIVAIVFLLVGMLAFVVSIYQLIATLIS